MSTPIGFFDCSRGAAGDMLLGALLDVGCPLDMLRDIVARLELPGVDLSVEKTKRGGFPATKVHVNVAPDSQREHRRLSTILEIIDRAALPPPVAENARSVFNRLAEAEAASHGIDVEKVHFHEVGAADAIVDIVCTCAAVEELKLQRIVCAPIPVGHGAVTCAHGVLPLPAPATARLLRGCPIIGGDAEGELTTPTGAALLTTLADEFGRFPEMKLDAIGCGAGTREHADGPNILRLFVGESRAADDCDSETITVLEAQVDDSTGQVLAYACRRFLETGALDAYIVPIIMKKGRPGQLLTVLCRPADAAKLEELILTETSTFGVRRHETRRGKLTRELVTVETAFGPVRVKIGRRGDAVVRAWPEFEDCESLARATGMSLNEIQQETLRVWSGRHE